MVEQGDFIIHLRSFEGGLEMANEDGIVSPAYTILRCKKPHSSLFYEAYFHTDEFINHILSKSVEGIRDGRQISYEAFKRLGLPYCNVSEQEKIAQLFCTLSHRIEKQQQMVDALKKYKRGAIKSIFTQRVSFHLLEHGADVNYRPAYTYGKIDKPVLHSAVINATWNLPRSFLRRNVQSGEILGVWHEIHTAQESEDAFAF